MKRRAIDGVTGCAHAKAMIRLTLPDGTRIQIEASEITDVTRDGSDATQEAPSFDDAVWLHHLFDRIAQSSREGERQTVE